MPQFCCTCGSLIVNDQCTNKNCTNRPASKSAASKQPSTRGNASAKKEAKSTRTKRASKCITYNLYEDKKEDGIG